MTDNKLLKLELMGNLIRPYVNLRNYYGGNRFTLVMLLEPLSVKLLNEMYTKIWFFQVCFSR